MTASQVQGAHVLLVEDDSEQRELMAMLLSHHGISCDTASGVAQARALLDRNRYDLLLTDYSLDDGFATELIPVSGMSYAHIAVITGHIAVEVPGGVRILRKPLDIDPFLQMLAEMLPSGPSSKGRAAGDSGESYRHAGSAKVQVNAAASKGRIASPLIAASPLIDVELAFYICASSTSSVAADRHLREALSRYDLTALTLHTIDLERNPEAAPQEDRVMFTPTLVRRRPLPRVWLIGDFSERAPLDDFLTSCSLARIRP